MSCSILHCQVATSSDLSLAGAVFNCFASCQNGANFISLSLSLAGEHVLFTGDLPMTFASAKESITKQSHPLPKAGSGRGSLHQPPKLSLGNTFGEALGASLGEVLGASLGEVLGAAFGEALGEAFGATLGDPFSSASPGTIFPPAWWLEHST